MGSYVLIGDASVYLEPILSYIPSVVSNQIKKKRLTTQDTKDPVVFIIPTDGCDTDYPLCWLITPCHLCVFLGVEI